MGELELLQGIVRFSYSHDSGTLSYLAGSPSLKTEKAWSNGCQSGQTAVATKVLSYSKEKLSIIGDLTVLHSVQTVLNS